MNKEHADILHKLLQRELNRKKYVAATASACGISEEEFEQLELALSKEKLCMTIFLLESRKSNKITSEFIKSITDQLWDWIKTPEDKREYRRPLSNKQWNCLV